MRQSMGSRHSHTHSGRDHVTFSKKVKKERKEKSPQVRRGALDRRAITATLPKRRGGAIKLQDVILLFAYAQRHDTAL